VIVGREKCVGGVLRGIVTASGARGAVFRGQDPFVGVFFVGGIIGVPVVVDTNDLQLVVDGGFRGGVPNCGGDKAGAIQLAFLK
jgi:hypothetical protein